MYKYFLSIFSIVLFHSSIHASLTPKDHVTGGYDVHAYFNMEDQEHAYQVYEDFLAFLNEKQIAIASSGFYLKIFERSPHPKPMWEVDFKQQDHLFEKMGLAITWLMLNRERLSVLVHPNTDKRTRESKIRDHTIYTLWMGPSVDLNVDPEIFHDEQ